MICGQSVALDTPAISLNVSARRGVHPEALPGNGHLLAVRPES